MDNLRILLCRESQDMGSFFAKFTTASGRGEDNHRDRFSDHSVTLPFRVTDYRVPAAPESHCDTQMRVQAQIKYE